MKIYVLLRDGVPLGYALAAATHCTLWCNCRLQSTMTAAPAV